MSKIKSFKITNLNIKLIKTFIKKKLDNFQYYNELKLNKMFKKLE